MIAKQKYRFVKDALWVSYTGLKDFTNCPRSYYLKNRYRDPKSGYRLQIAASAMTLGSLVHDAIKWYLQTGRTASFDEVIKLYRNRWLKYQGKRGGFATRKEEGDFGKRGLDMLDNFYKNKGILEKNIPAYDFLRYWLDDKAVLTGKADFIGELQDGSLHVLDFKTGTKDQDDLTQLYIYGILAESNFEKPVSRISYWYLDRDSAVKEAVLDSLEGKLEWIKGKVKVIEEALLKNEWVCIKGENQCSECKKYQAVIDGKGQFQFSDEAYKKDIYFLDPLS
ncbi:PD-(D/E)XK nuclease family protein [Patescibacteria group bacterium]|nr:PD-(D/E)XK nuclease family protein [Patescibacteria group bacterium]